MPSQVRLSVNVDHVATVRQARRAPYPDPVAAARLAEDAGAAGITAHLRADRRHIQDADVARLRAAVRGKLNLEMSIAAEMLAVAVAVRPDQVTLVPERPEEVTTEGGLDLAGRGAAVLAAAERLAVAGIAVSVFVDPDQRQIEALLRLVPSPVLVRSAGLEGAAGAGPAAAPRAGDSGAQGGAPPPGARALIAGVEINTDAYTRAALAAANAVPASAPQAPPGASLDRELDTVRRAAALITGHGFHLYAGHGLTTGNVGAIAAIAGMEELNIGHALIARAILVGVPEAVREMLRAMGGAPA
jgi:pyridoxine 5-phosphate synthase